MMCLSNVTPEASAADAEAAAEAGAVRAPEAAPTLLLTPRFQETSTKQGCDPLDVKPARVSDCSTQPPEEDAPILQDDDAPENAAAVSASTRRKLPENFTEKDVFELLFPGRAPPGSAGYRPPKLPWDDNDVSDMFPKPLPKDHPDYEAHRADKPWLYVTFTPRTSFESDTGNTPALMVDLVHQQMEDILDDAVACSIYEEGQEAYLEGGGQIGDEKWEWMNERTENERKAQKVFGKKGVRPQGAGARRGAHHARARWSSR